jgi:hypothetical protein
VRDEARADELADEHGEVWRDRGHAALEVVKQLAPVL